MALGHFTEGSIWSTAGAAKVLTTGLVVGDEIFVARECELTFTFVLSGTAPTTVDLQWEQSIDGGTTWVIVPISDTALDGASDHALRLELSPYTHYRMSAKRTGGDGTTALLATAQASRPTGWTGAHDEDGSLYVATGPGGLTAAVSGDVAHDAVDSGNPVKTGFRARATQIAAVADDDRADAIATVYGEQVVAGYDWTADALKGNLTHVADTATNVNGGNRDAGTQTVTLADDDPAVVDLAAIEVLQTTIAGDTTSIDGKTPALGTAAEAGSVPVTVATDDPHYGAVGAAADVDGVVHGQLRYVGETAAAIQTAVEVMDDWDNAASDGASVSGDTAHDAADAGEPVKVGGRARTSQIAAVANDDRADLITNAYGEPVHAGYDWSADANRVEEVNPLSSQYAADKLVETNIATNTTTYHYVDMAGYRYLTIQGETDGTTPTDVLTVTVEASAQDDGTAAASCDYQDVTNALFGVASWVDTDFMALTDQAMAFKFVRVKYVTSNGAGNDCDLTLYIRKAW